MPDPVASVSEGRFLDLAGYEADFAEVFRAVSATLWKLERAQTFREPGSASWEAFAAGRWDEALAEAERLRGDFVSYFEDMQKAGSGLRRIRMVEKPITPYLQWELYYLRVRAQSGEQVRVLDVAGASDHEARSGGTLPELLVVGGQVGYRVRYSETGEALGAHKITDESVVTGWRDMIAELFDRGEDLEDFFVREVAPLPPPAV